MKITQNGLNYKKLKEEANKDCNKCPACGEESKCEIVSKTGIRQYHTKYFRNKIMGIFPHGDLYAIDYYRCYTCNTYFQSDPYPIGKDDAARIANWKIQ